MGLGEGGKVGLCQDLQTLEIAELLGHQGLSDSSGWCMTGRGVNKSIEVGRVGGIL